MTGHQPIKDHYFLVRLVLEFNILQLKTVLSSNRNMGNPPKLVMFLPATVTEVLETLFLLAEVRCLVLLTGATLLTIDTRLNLNFLANLLGINLDKICHDCVRVALPAAESYPTRSCGVFVPISINRDGHYTAKHRVEDVSDGFGVQTTV